MKSSGRWPFWAPCRSFRLDLKVDGAQPNKKNIGYINRYNYYYIRWVSLTFFRADCIEVSSGETTGKCTMESLTTLFVGYYLLFDSFWFYREFRILLEERVIIEIFVRFMFSVGLKMSHLVIGPPMVCRKTHNYQFHRRYHLVAF